MIDDPARFPWCPSCETSFLTISQGIVHLKDCLGPLESKPSCDHKRRSVGSGIFFDSENGLTLRSDTFECEEGEFNHEWRPL